MEGLKLIISINRLIDDNNLHFEEIISSPIFYFWQGSLGGIAIDYSVDPSSNPSWKRVGSYEELRFESDVEERVFIRLIHHQAKAVLIQLICKKKYGQAFFLHPNNSFLSHNLSLLGTRKLMEILNEN